MSKEKQIEEMAQIIRNRLPHIGRSCVEGECINGDKNFVHENPCWCVYKEIAEMIYNAGYRKQSEGRWTYGVDRGDTMKCTLCRRRMPKIDNARYCPNCGAKMKGGTEQ